MSNGYQITEEELTKCNWVPDITEEELSFAEDLWNRDPSPDEQRLDDWLRVMEEIVATIDIPTAHHFNFWRATI